MVFDEVKDIIMAKAADVLTDCLTSSLGTVASFIPVIGPFASVIIKIVAGLFFKKKDEKEND